MLPLRARLSLALLPVAGFVSILTGGGCSGEVPIGLQGQDGGSSSSGSSGGSGSSSSSSGSSTSGSSGDCCPDGWDLYACSFADGGAGMACHNPAMGCASSSTCGSGCDAVVSGSCSGGQPEGGSTTLKWWNTCGDPVCLSPTDDGGGTISDDAGNACPPVGTTCTTPGQTRGVRNSHVACGATEECSATNPTSRPGGCPISSRNFKADIRYVDDAQLDQLHEEALSIRLATYNYRQQFGDPNVRHLGFIVEDDPQSPAVDRGFDRVDMYGYLSMVVATMQVQEKEIAALRRELDEARGGSCSSR